MPLQLPALPALPTWAQTKTTAKSGFDKVYGAVDKLGPHVNKLSNKVGAEAFWPTTLDKESDKAARILRSFCKDGFYVDEKTDGVTKEGKPKGKQRVVKKIPESVIKNAKGLAIFTVMRTGLWFSGAGGSGILVGRMANGEWSPPSGIVLHTAGLGFLAGADIYDCVMVINTEEALQAFTKLRCTIGGEVSATAGPVGIGGVLETEVHKRQAPVWNYLKSRGLYGGVQVDGTIIVERMDENEKFYGQKLPAQDILAGKVLHPPKEIQGLINTIKAAQGDRDVDESVLPSTSEPLPSDYNFSEGSSTFGLPPDESDLDPFGVKSLQEEGLEIREAGTKTVPTAEAFEYRPTMTSPINTTFKEAERRRSIIQARRLSVDASTQTDNVYRPKYHLRAPPPLPPRRPVSVDEEPLPMYEEGTESMETTEKELPIKVLDHEAPIKTVDTDDLEKEEESVKTPETDDLEKKEEAIKIVDTEDLDKKEEFIKSPYIADAEEKEETAESRDNEGTEKKEGSAENADDEVPIDMDDKKEEKKKVKEENKDENAPDSQGFEQIELGGKGASEERSMPGGF